MKLPNTKSRSNFASLPTTSFACCFAAMEDIASDLANIPNRKRDGSATSHASSKKETNVGDIEEQYKGLDVEQLRLKIRDGRLCIFLQHKDTDPDPVFPKELLYWHRAPKKLQATGQSMPVLYENLFECFRQQAGVQHCRQSC